MKIDSLFLKIQLTIKSIAFRGIILAMAFCYIVSPIKHSLFDVIHVVSHYVEDHIQLKNKKETSIFKIHAHDYYGNHLSANTPPLVNHNHTATGKVIPNHSHNLLAVLDLIISTSDDHRDHQKSIFKAEIDKHLVTVEYTIKDNLINTTSKKIWYTFLSHYNYSLPTLPLPPQYIS